MAMVRGENRDFPKKIVIFRGKSRFFAASEPFSAPLSAFSFSAFTAFSAFFLLAHFFPFWRRGL